MSASIDTSEREAVAAITVPRDLLEQASASIGAFCSNEGWGDSDMVTLDNLLAALERGVAAESIAGRLAEQGITLLDSSTYLRDSLCPAGVLTRLAPSLPLNSASIAWCRRCGAAPKTTTTTMRTLSPGRILM